MTDSTRLQALLQSIGEHKRPPVHLWNPTHEGSIDITIRRDGSWIHEGGEIKREAMVRLFASILRFENDRYFLVTPVEKLEIHVEDVPFVAVAMEVFDQSTDQQKIAFRSNLGEHVLVDSEHAISVSYSASGEPSPYVIVRDRLKALLGRSVWLELAELAVEHKGVASVLSHGMYFALTD